MKWLQKMADLARQARHRGETSQNLLKVVVEVKIRNTTFFQFYEDCKHEQMETPSKYETMFDEINKLLNDNTTGKVNDMDIQIGFLIFSTVMYCNADEIKLYSFLEKLIDKEAPRTIIRSIVTSIESGNLTEVMKAEDILIFY